MTDRDDKKTLQDLFANKFKEKKKREEQKTQQEEALVAMLIGILLMVGMGLMVFLPAIINNK
ncbi:hypothetical protein D3C71_1922230 [compost metagenome]